MRYSRLTLAVPFFAMALLVGSTWAGAEEATATPTAKTEVKAEKAAKTAECKAKKNKGCEKAQACDKAHTCDKSQGCDKDKACPKAQGCDRAGAQTGVLEGQLVDMKCHLSMGAAGKGHDQCAVQCAKSGMPVGLEDAASDMVYTVLTAPAGLAEIMGQKVRITGTRFCGSMAVAPEKIEVEKDGSWTEYKLPESPM